MLFEYHSSHGQDIVDTVYIVDTVDIMKCGYFIFKSAQSSFHTDG